MAKEIRSLKEVLAENEELHARLEEAEETIHAIQSGEVDAVVVSGPQGEQVYTLSGAERTYRILVEAMNEGALVLSPEGIIVYCNRTFAAMLSLPVYDVLGHSIYDFVSYADVESLKHMLEHVHLRAGRKEINFTHSDTSSITASISVGNLETDDGLSVSAVVTDLTEVKKTEAELTLYREHLEELIIERTNELNVALEDLEVSNEELMCTSDELHREIKSRKSIEEALREGEATLRESEINYRELVQNANSAIIRWKCDGTITFFNEYAQKFFGYSEKEILGKNVLKLVPEIDSSGIDLTKISEEVVNNPDTYLTDVNENILKDGSRVWMSWTNKPIYDVHGIIVEVFAVGSDITERKIAEEEVRELAQQLNSHMENTPLAVIEFDEDYRVTRWSKEAEHVFGWTAKEIFEKVLMKCIGSTKKIGR